jgi:hypothetical protein
LNFITFLHPFSLIYLKISILLVYIILEQGQLTDILVQFDTNKDGTISIDELQTVMESMGGKITKALFK